MAPSICPATWTRHAGDVGDTLKVQVSEAFGATLDAVTAVSCRLEDVRGSLPNVDLSATVTDSANREVTVELATWLASQAVPGQQWWVSLRITAGVVGPVTFPEKRSERLGLHIA